MANTGMQTRAVHGGEAPDPTTGASAPNLVMSTNFAMGEPAGFSIHSPDSQQPYVYTRWGNPTVQMLEAKLAALEGAEDCVAFASGMVHLGGALSPFNAWLIARGAATLPIRMRAHEAAARQVAGFLEAHPAVRRVNYPGLESHPQHALACRQMANFSGMLSFQAAGDEALARRMAQELEIVHFAVSLGHQRSLLFWIGTDAIVESSYQLTGDALARYREFAGDGLFRLSVGLEDADDICRDLGRVLD